MEECIKMQNRYDKKAIKSDVDTSIEYSKTSCYDCDMLTKKQILLILLRYIIDRRSSFRSLAKYYGVSKSLISNVIKYESAKYDNKLARYVYIKRFYNRKQDYHTEIFTNMNDKKKIEQNWSNIISMINTGILTNRDFDKMTKKDFKELLWH